MNCRHGDRVTPACQFYCQFVKAVASFAKCFAAQDFRDTADAKRTSGTCFAFHDFALQKFPPPLVDCLPCWSHPRRRSALCQPRINHLHGLGTEWLPRLARFSDIHVSKRPEVEVGPTMWPHVTPEVLGSNNLVWRRLELTDIKSARRNYLLLVDIGEKAW